jgi:uncharacterized protein (DUF58 family)
MIRWLATLCRAGSRGWPRSRRWARIRALWPKRGGATARRTSRAVVCREGRYYAALACLVLAAAMLREVNLMLLLAGLLFGPLVFNWRLTAVTLRGLDLRRTLPSGICAGDPLVVHLELANTRRRIGSWAVTVRERVFCEGRSPVRPVGTTEFFPYVAAGGSSVRSYRGRLPHRGRYRWEPAQVGTRFPFGLFRREVSLGCGDALLVYPRLGQLTQEWIKRRHDWFEASRRRQQRQSRVSGDFYGVRQWRHGDSRRWIHWRSTARHGTLVVRQFEQHRNCDVAILLDLWQPENPSPRDLENVELAVSFTATVVADVCRKGNCNVLLGTSSPGPQFVAATASLVLLEDALTRLSLVEASAGDDLPQLLEHALGRIDPGTEVVVISTRSVNLDDRRRFALLWGRSLRGDWTREVRIVTTAEGDLDRYFCPKSE